MHGRFRGYPTLVTGHGFEMTMNCCPGRDPSDFGGLTTTMLVACVPTASASREALYCRQLQARGLKVGSSGLQLTTELARFWAFLLTTATTPFHGLFSMPVFFFEFAMAYPDCNYFEFESFLAGNHVPFLAGR
jgi:hypothetical protein